MRIRGCSKPSCALCVYSKKKDNEDMLFCTKTSGDTDKKASCSKFSYDIFKYTPVKKEDLSKFSKKDFEI